MNASAAVVGIDTSTHLCGVAIVRDQEVLAHHVLSVEESHSEHLMPMIQGLLADMSLDRTRIGGLAVTIGPGSFTGLRIGMAAVKALAYATDVPVRGVNTLLASAWSVRGVDAVVCAAIDARRDHFYCAFYDGALLAAGGDSPVAGHEDGERLSAEAIAARIADTLAAGRQVCVAGQGSAALYRRLHDLGVGSGGTAPDETSPGSRLVVLPHGAQAVAVNTALIGAADIEAGRHDDLFHLAPHYVRRSEAERRWKQSKSSSTR